MHRMVGIAGLLTLLVGLCFAAPGRAAAGWEANLRLAQGQLDSRLSFGQMPGATAGQDGRYDVPAMLTGPLQGAFVRGTTRLWRDIRGDRATPEPWILEIRTTDPDRVTELSWDDREFPPGLRMTMTDTRFGREMDMHGQHHYAYSGVKFLRLLIKVKPR